MPDELRSHFSKGGRATQRERLPPPEGRDPLGIDGAEGRDGALTSGRGMDRVGGAMLRGSTVLGFEGGRETDGLGGLTLRDGELLGRSTRGGGSTRGRDSSTRRGGSGALRLGSDLCMVRGGGDSRAGSGMEISLLDGDLAGSDLVVSDREMMVGPDRTLLVTTGLLVSGGTTVTGRLSGLFLGGGSWMTITPRDCVDLVVVRVFSREVLCSREGTVRRKP